MNWLLKQNKAKDTFSTGSQNQKPQLIHSIQIEPSKIPKVKNPRYKPYFEVPTL